MNRVSLVGRITNKPELRYTNTQTAYTKFGLAVTRTYNRKETDFINITAWRKQAEIVCQYLDKGSLISVDGRIQTGSFVDKDGNKRYSFDVMADNVQFLESKAQAQARISGAENDVDPYSFQDEQYQDLENKEDVYEAMGDSIALDDADID